MSDTTIREQIVALAKSEYDAKKGNIYGPYYNSPSSWNWCAYFVNYVFDKLGDSGKNLILRSGRTDVSEKDFRDRNAFISAPSRVGKNNYVDPNGRTPQAGDIIYFDSYTVSYDKDGNEIWTKVENQSSEHIGIVSHIQNGMVYYYDGNNTTTGSSASTRYVSYCSANLNASKILGYGLINAPTSDILPPPNPGSNSSFVYPGQVVSNVTIGSNHYQEVQSGGIASSCVIKSGGTQKVNTGGNVVSTVISSGGYLNLLDSYYLVGTSASRTAQATNVTILSGGLMSDRGGADWYTIVANGGKLNVFKQGLSISANVQSGGLQKLNSGASARYAQIDSGGKQEIISGGSAYITRLNGYQYVYSGGVASSTRVSSGGVIVANSGGSAFSVIVNNAGATMFYEGSYASDVVVSSGGKFGADAGATVYGINYNRTDSYSNFSVSNGVAQNVCINGQWLKVKTGQSAINTLVTGGLLTLSGGNAINTTLNGAGREVVRDGARSSNTYVSSGASQHILSSSLALSAYVYGGSQIIDSGASACYTKIYSQGAQEVYGFASNTTLNNAAYQYVREGGYTVNVSVGSNSRQVIFSGASAVLVYASNGGGVIVSSGAAASQINVSGGGLLNILSGGVAYNATIYANGVQRVSSGGSASGVYVRGTQYVYGGGQATGVTVSSGGSQLVYSGGVTKNVLVSSGGSQSILSGGSALNVSVFAGGKQYVSSGGYVSGGRVYAGGSHIASAGANVYNLVIDGTPFAADAYEPNNTLATAGALTSSGSINGLSIHTSSDVDYYKFNLSGRSGSNNFVKINLAAASGDLDMELLDSAGNVVKRANSTSSTENISLDGLNAGAYYAKIYGYNGAEGAYSLSWNAVGTQISADSYEPNNTLATAAAITSSGSISGLSIHTPNDVDYYKFNLTGKGGSNNFVKINLATTTGDLDMELLDSAGNVVKSAKSTSATENISLDGLNAGAYYAKIYGYDGAMGAYNLAWNAIGTQISGDIYEPNNTMATAAAITSSGSISGLSIHTSEDVDYYKFNLTGKGTTSNYLKLAIADSGVDLDMDLLDSTGAVVTQARTTSATENISLNGLNAGAYYAKIYGYNGASGAYSLSWNAVGTQISADSYEPNNTLATAAAITSSGSLSGLSIHSSEDVDYYKFNLTGMGGSNNYVKINLAAATGDLDMELLDSAGNVVKSAKSTSATENISLDGLNAGAYYAKIYGYNGATGAYSLTWNAKGTQISADRYEPNNTLATAVAITSSGSINGLSIHTSSDVDYYKFNLSGKGGSNNFVKINLVSSSGDLDMELLDSAGNVVKSAKSTSATENISLDGLNAGAYYAKIYGYDGAMGAYSLSWNAKGSVVNPTPVVPPSGGVQIVRSGAITSGVKILSGGGQYVYYGGLTKSTRVSGGSQIVYSGGRTSGSIIYGGGRQIVSSGGVASKTKISAGGIQILSGGSSVDAIIKNGGVQSGNGKSLRTLVSSGGWQFVNSFGVASSGSILRGGFQRVFGSAVNVSIAKGAGQIVEKGGVASATKLSGVAQIFSGGMICNPSVLSGATLGVFSGAKLKFTKKTSIQGEVYLSGGIISGTKAAALNLGKKGTIVFAGKAKINASPVNIGSGSITVNGTGNTAAKITSVSKSRLTFDISATAAKGTTVMLKTTSASALNGSATIQTALRQQVGVYELATNITRKTAFTVYAGGKKRGNIKIGGTLTKEGVTYKLAKKSNQLNLTISIQRGAIFKGGAKAETLKGTSKSEIFYGGKGNDVIKGNGGRDVAVYDRNNWGKDTIKSTTGTMTIVFNGVKASEINQKLAGKNLTITRKGTSGQSITINNWSAATHNIVFGGTMGNFSKFVAAAKPTAAQTNKASNEVWKKAGLLA